MVLLFSMTNSYSQKYEGITKTVSVRILQNGVWSNWSKPESAKVRLVIDVSNSRVIIYSKKLQVYTILSSDSHYYDNRSECWDYKVLDQDDDIGTLVVRCGKNWIQIYIRFEDIQWVYYLE